MHWVCGCMTLFFIYVCMYLTSTHINAVSFPCFLTTIYIHNKHLILWVGGRHLQGEEYIKLRI